MSLMAVSFGTSFIKAIGYANTYSAVAGITVLYVPRVCHVEPMLESISTGTYCKIRVFIVGWGGSALGVNTY